MISNRNQNISVGGHGNASHTNMDTGPSSTFGDLKTKKPTGETRMK